MYQRVMKDYLWREGEREGERKGERKGGRGTDSVPSRSVEVCAGGGFPSPSSGRRDSLEEKIGDV